LLKPEFRPGYYELARAQINANREQQALETLEKARATFGPDFDLEYLSAVACTLGKDYTNSLKHYAAAETFALATETNRLAGDLRGRFYFEFGVACERKGDCAQAEHCFEECLRYSPDFAEALNYLGFMWADRGEKLDRARDLIGKAVKIDPKNAAYLDSMGWVLFKLRELKPALDHVLDAIRLSDEPDPVLYDHLGDIYSAMGQNDKAIEAWNKALSLEPNDAVRKKIQSAGKFR
jgi:tetratricopeptide (TPR) repeat protein